MSNTCDSNCCGSDGHNANDGCNSFCIRNKVAYENDILELQTIMQRRLELERRSTKHHNIITHAEQLQQEEETETIFKLCSHLQRANHQSELTILTLQRQLMDQAKERNDELKTWTNQVKVMALDYEDELSQERKGFAEACVRHGQEVKKLRKRCKRNAGLEAKVLELEKELAGIKLNLEQEHYASSEDCTAATCASSVDELSRLGSNGSSSTSSSVLHIHREDKEDVAYYEHNVEGGSNTTSFISKIIGLPSSDSLEPPKTKSKVHHHRCLRRG